MRRHELLNTRLRFSILLLGALLCGCDDRGDVDGWTHVAWSPDESSVALLAGEDRTQLLIGHWPEDSWMQLALAGEKQQFLHPLWLRDDQGEWLISVFIIAATGTSEQKGRDEVFLKIFRLRDGASLEYLAEPASREMMAMNELETVQPGPERTSLIYAGHVGDHYEVRELYLGTSRRRTILSSHAARCSARISSDGRWLAFLEDTAEAGTTLSVYAMHAVWSGPASRWILNKLLPSSYISTAYEWKLLSWSPDAAWLLIESRSAAGAGLILLRPTDLVSIPLPHRGLLQEAVWSSTGRYLGYREEVSGQAGKSSSITIYDTYSNALLCIPIDIGVQLQALPDGEVLLYAEVGEAGILGSLDPRSREITPILAVDSKDTEMLVSPTGRQVVHRSLPRDR